MLPSQDLVLGGVVVLALMAVLLRMNQDRIAAGNVKSWRRIIRRIEALENHVDRKLAALEERLLAAIVAELNERLEKRSGEESSE